VAVEALFLLSPKANEKFKAWAFKACVGCDGMKRKLPVNVRFAGLDDLDFCIKSDFKRIRSFQIKRKIEEREVIISEAEGEPIGYLRIEYLWLRMPYVGLIFIKEGHRGRGIGTAMIKFLESYLIANGHKVLYSSSQVNEPGPQMWHRRIGFEECGYIAGVNEGGVGEVFFRKNIDSDRS
jgi:GNAT superfamily N-acetyltransferase